MNTEKKEFEVTGQSDRRLAKRLDEIALALILVMTGALWLAPKAMLPEGAWLVGVGLIVLGLNGVRRMRGLRTGGFGILVGLVALAAGIGRAVGEDLPIVPVLLIVLGVGLVVKAAAAKDRRGGNPAIR
jgi:uncharacterized membrane protein YccC